MGRKHRNTFNTRLETGDAASTDWEDAETFALTQSDTNLLNVARQLFECQLQYEHPEQAFPTAQELAKMLRLNPDEVKKRLKILLKLDYAQIVNYTPKRYRVDGLLAKALAQEADLEQALKQHLFEVVPSP